MLLWRTVSSSQSSSSSTESRPRRVRVGIVGAKQTGKSALLVRFLTHRFIGEYHSGTDLNYEHVLSDNPSSDLNNLARDDDEDLVIIDFCDFSNSETKTCLPRDAWSLDALVVVYSVSDRVSFDVAKTIVAEIDNGFRGQVLVLANKADLKHCAQVGREEGKALSQQLRGSSFAETSAAEQGAEFIALMHNWLNVITAKKTNIGSLAESMCGRRHSLLPSAPKYGRKSSLLLSAVGNLLLSRTHSVPCKNHNLHDFVNHNHFNRIIKKRSV